MAQAGAKFLATFRGAYMEPESPKVVSIVEGRSDGCTIWDAMADEDRILWLQFRETLPDSTSPAEILPAG